MKKMKVLLFALSFLIAILSIGAGKVFASTSVDCSVSSSKVCVTVQNGPYTTTYYGKAKPKPPAQP